MNVVDDFLADVVGVLEEGVLAQEGGIYIDADFFVVQEVRVLETFIHLFWTHVVHPIFWQAVDKEA